MLLDKRKRDKGCRTETALHNDHLRRTGQQGRLSARSDRIWSPFHWSGRCAVAAIGTVAREPAQALHQFRRQLHAVGIDLESPFKYLACATVHIQITTGRLGIQNVAALIFELFKTTAPAPLTNAVPLPFTIT